MNRQVIKLSAALCSYDRQRVGPERADRLYAYLGGQLLADQIWTQNGQIGPKWENPGLFQIRFQYILAHQIISEIVPDFPI